MRSKLNRIDRLILSGYLIVTFSVFLSYIFRYGRGDYNFSEYFVNYSSGFVRRGLPGEIFLRIPSITRESIFFTLLTIHLLALISNYLLIYKISKKIGLSGSQIVVFMLHPSLVGYYSWSYSNAFKKDLIMENFILLIVYFFLLYFDKRHINRLITYLILSLIIMPFFMLVHEIIFFISAAVYAVMFYRIFLDHELKDFIVAYNKKIILFIFFFTLNCVLFFTLTLLKNEYDPIKTFQSVDKFMPLSYGPFPFLTNSTENYASPVLLKLQNGENLVTYALGFFAVLAVFYFSLCLYQRKLFVILFLVNSPILWFALIFSDWDRIIVFWSFSFFATYSIYRFKNNLLNLPSKKNFSYLLSMFSSSPWLPGLLIFLAIRVPTGNPAKLEEISMLWLLLENVLERF